MTIRPVLTLLFALSLAASHSAVAQSPAQSSAQSSAQSAAAPSPDTAPCSNSTVEQALGPEAGVLARQFLSQLQSAFAANDKNKIAGMVSYPMTQIHNGKPVKIATRAKLLSEFDQIFTPQVRSKIASQSSRCLFGTALGAVIGDGEVWFTQHSANGPFKIITVNSDSGRL
jgi:hypothetical protein